MSTVIITQSSLSRGRCVSGIWHDPPGDLGLIPELPGGYTIYRTHPGSPILPSGWLEFGGTGSVSLQTDAGAPRSPSDLLRVTYPVGFPAGDGPVRMYFNTSPATSVFLTYWIRYSANFQGHGGSSVNKNFFLFPGSGGNYFYTCCAFSGVAATAYYDLNVEAMTGSGSGSTPFTGSDHPWLIRDSGPAASPLYLAGEGVGQIVVDHHQWHRVSFEFIQQTAGDNGVISMWVDGVLSGRCSTLNYPDSFGEFQLAPTWGGNDAETVNEEQWFDLDEVHVYTK